MYTRATEKMQQTLMLLVPSAHRPRMQKSNMALKARLDLMFCPVLFLSFARLLPVSIFIAAHMLDSHLKRKLRGNKNKTYENDVNVHTHEYLNEL